MTPPVAPAVVDRGPGDPEVAVVSGVHGDEPSGVRAIRTLLDDGLDLRRGVRFVIANPPAYASNERYLDVDLNRVFPGDPDAADRERQLAAALCDSTAGLPTLSLHSTHSHPDPIALVELTDEVADLARQLPVGEIVDETPAIDGAFTDCSSVITLETGCQQTADATETAIAQTRAFLAVAGAIDDDVPDVESTFYRLEETVEKPPDASYDLRAENFERVEAGNVFATTDETTLTADHDFVPILLSECGYEDIFGYNGRLLGSSLEGARQRIRD